MEAIYSSETSVTAYKTTRLVTTQKTSAVNTLLEYTYFPIIFISFLY
jgi:hypothetical protein